MGEDTGRMEGNVPIRRFWGLRPWKRHGLILMVSGTMYLIIGVQYIITQETPGRRVALAAVLQVAPIQFWGGVFATCGVLAMISSRWPPVTETWGYIVLSGISAAWSTAYLAGIFWFDSPEQNTTQVMLWGGFAFMWWAVSGLLNPDRTAVITHVAR